MNKEQVVFLIMEEHIKENHSFKPCKGCIWLAYQLAKKQALTSEIEFLESISYQIKTTENSFEFITCQKVIKQRIAELKGALLE
jgi:hypoxanthine-guanine phosphoribosyltransferase